MSKSYYDAPDPNLLAWATALAGHLTDAPEAYFVTPETAAAFQSVTSAFGTTLSAWQNRTTRTPVAMEDKTAARSALLIAAKNVIGIIDTNPQCTNSIRTELQIPIRKKPTPIPAPSQSPKIDVVAVNGRTVTLQLHGDSPRRGRPTGVQGCSIFSFSGTTPPTDPAGWKFEALATKTTFDLTFDGSEAGMVWVTAFWYSARAQSSAACAPVQINLPAAPVVPVSESMKIAA